MDDDADDLRLEQGSEPRQFEISWLYAVPCFMASLVVSVIIGNVLPSMWGIREIVIVLVTVAITIATLREIQRHSARR